MIISHDKRFVFVRNPKTASTSCGEIIEQSLLQNGCYNSYLSNKVYSREYLSIYCKEIPKSYKFVTHTSLLTLQDTLYNDIFRNYEKVSSL